MSHCTVLLISWSVCVALDELIDITHKYGLKVLIDEGSYGILFYDFLKGVKAAAIKKLDSSKQPDQEFLSELYTIL